MERHELAARLSPWLRDDIPESSVVDQTDPVRFMAAFAAAVAANGNIFLANPGWQAAERAELARIVESGPARSHGWLMIPTGGSGGVLKFARHDGDTVAAAVEGFSRHFEMERVNAVNVLPLHHVSGLMAWMRSALTGGVFLPWDWKDLERGRFPPVLPEAACLSLVPTQLQRLLGSEAAIAWLRGFHAIFIGGGPAWGSLLDAAAGLGLPLSPGFGATETAAMAVAVSPAQFLSGMRGCGLALPHATIEIEHGVLRVTGDSVFRGYFPAFCRDRSWVSEDAAHLSADGSLMIEGRRDDVIISGGKKVAPAEVEALLRASGEFEDVAVVGVPDPEWGQVIAACHPAGGRAAQPGRIAEALSGIAAYKRPKLYLSITPWPRNAQGKINRGELVRRALVSLQPPSPPAP